MVLLSMLAAVSCLTNVLAAQAGQSIISFEDSSNGFLLADSSSGPTIAVAGADWYGVQRAAQDLAQDFGRVTGQNGTVQLSNGTSPATTTIIVGTIGNSGLIDSLISAGQLDIWQIQGQWEAYQLQLVNMNGTQALVIAGADKRGTIFGIYEVSQQIGVSPWHWFADVATMQREQIYTVNTTIVQSSPSVKYRGIFINDEQPGLTNWIREHYPDVEYGPGFTHLIYVHVYELLLRLKGNYFWPAMWGSMFYIDDPNNAKTADDYGIVMGTSHTEPLARATNEQSNFMNGTWSWAYNKDNVTEFMRQGAERASPYETLFTLGMRGLGDEASPTLNASSLNEIVNVQQSLLRDVFNTTNLTGIPQMWCLYKEVGEYFAEGLDVPDDVTLLWAEDNWGNAQRLPYANETSRSGGAGLYYHVDYVGSPRDYKWINTINLQKSWFELQQAYARGAQTIWILNVGDLKNLELPIHHFMDMAYDVERWSTPSSSLDWLSSWAARSFSSDVSLQVGEIMANYSVLAGRRKYELLEPWVYSLINEEEADRVLSEWSQLSESAQEVYSSLPQAQQAGFFELILHPILAGSTVTQIQISIARNNVYASQGRTSANTMAAEALRLFDIDYSLTQQYHNLLDGKWNNILDQTHIGYTYWQQPMRNSLPPLSYVQTREISLAGPLGVTCEGTNASVPGDDQYHSLSSNVLTLPYMDSYGPDSRWFEVFSRGNGPVSFNVSVNDSAVSVSPVSSGTLGMNGTDTDRRLYFSVDWSRVPEGQSMVLVNVTTSTITRQGDINVTDHLYGSGDMPQLMLPLNKTSIPEDTPVGAFVGSNGYISMNALHYTKATNGSSSAYLSMVPGLTRLLNNSGIALMPFVQNGSLKATDDTPHLTYSFYYPPANMSGAANLTMYFVPGLNTDGTRPLQYAARLVPSGGSASANSTQIVKPVPETTSGVLPKNWHGMVADFALTSTTTWNMTRMEAGNGLYDLDVWLLTPGLVLDKLVLDLTGQLGRTYLGPRESYSVGG